MPGPSNLDYIEASLPSTYCFLVALSCLPFMRGKWLIFFGALIYVLLAVFIVAFFMHTAKYGAVDWFLNSLFGLLPLSLLAYGWTILCRRRLKKRDS